MDEVLIDNINNTVGENDTLYHLGDFAFGPRDDRAYIKKVAEYRYKIKCKNIHLIWGNHDRRYMRHDYERLFTSIRDLDEIRVNNQKIVLCHYAMLVWNGSHRGVWHLYGHSHGTLPDNPETKAFDAGVDCHNYFPLSFEEVKAIMDKKTYVPVDRHGTEH